MKHQTVLDQVEVTRDGTIQVRLTLEIVDDAGNVLASAYHRTMLPPGHDINLQMDAVNAHLQRMGKAPVGLPDVAKLHDVGAIVWKPEVVKAYQDKQAAAADFEAELAAANAAMGKKGI